MKKSLKLVFASEPDADGKVRTKGKTYSRVNPEVTDEVLKTIGTGIGSLYKKAPEEVRKIEEVTL